ncbi:hypothetical protein D7S86_24785 [Pararobbsia silviterrae]|uniref:Uncharacterized protein n=2 Tax=Pararobbsia silviterrae TaxID=1792498 RepID=A0A494XDD5_9BURK|nr:hypothetical protein D7S86_24785 [Pararobbsia silviterrae]
MIEWIDAATRRRCAPRIPYDIRQNGALPTHGVYRMPIGGKGISMIDVRGIDDARAGDKTPD